MYVEREIEREIKRERERDTYVYIYIYIYIYTCTQIVCRPAFLLGTAMSSSESSC